MRGLTDIIQSFRQPMDIGAKIDTGLQMMQELYVQSPAADKVKRSGVKAIALEDIAAAVYRTAHPEREDITAMLQTARNYDHVRWEFGGTDVYKGQENYDRILKALKLGDEVLKRDRHLAAASRQAIAELAIQDASAELSLAQLDAHLSTEASQRIANTPHSKGRG